MPGREAEYGEVPPPQLPPVVQLASLPDPLQEKTLWARVRPGVADSHVRTRAACRTCRCMISPSVGHTVRSTLRPLAARTSGGRGAGNTLAPATGSSENGAGLWSAMRRFVLNDRRRYRRRV